MPELFHLDNFDHCMLNQNEALYCTFTYQLRPLDKNSLIWNIIQNVSSSPQNYNHTQLRHGLCVPTSCPDEYNNSDSTLEAIQFCYDQKMSLLGLAGNVTTLDCQGATSRYPVDLFDWVVAGVLGAYVLFVLFASLYEEKVIRKSIYISKSLAGRIIEAFSVPKNWNRLVAASPSSDHKKLRVIQGLRFFTMFGVILSHTLMGIFYGPVSNTQYTENMTKDILNMLVAQGFYVVQTFFMISGFLFSYQFFEKRSMDKKVDNSFFMWSLFFRYIRMTPTLLVVWAIHSTWLVHLYNGPYWDSIVGDEYRNCRKNGWSNFLYINNMLYPDKMCLQQTWYLAVDMQVFILGLIALFIINKYPKKMYHIFGIILTVSLIIPGIVAYVENHDILFRQYPETLYGLNGLTQKIYHDLFISTYSNLFGFFIGMVFGHIFVQHKEKDLRNNKVLSFLWWIFSFGLCLSVIMIAAVFYDMNYKYTALESALYWALGKNIFALGMSVMLLGFIYRIGGITVWLMDREIVQVLGKLTFSCYMIHVVFIKMEIGYKRYPVSINDTKIFIAVIGDVGISYLAGLLLCLLVEMPMSAIQKILMSKPPKMPPRKPINTIAGSNIVRHYMEQDTTFTKV
ncbi:nose resistant to fluoxetine protein 6-like isoform X2 [Sitophilus oryzae]|nr:nose resistant to fluoxetine protein 6-like isoform X2 [Sitophilus oryzae]